ncbi:hypothetical protein V5O48_015539 [Marasmius crinis-equi]|uniref:Uncharacterized protein n=1 Tax=Marasmius crinis-equi TaxID=585013 RepID=A0ABR3EUA3_9AGAR
MGDWVVDGDLEDNGYYMSGLVDPKHPDEIYIGVFKDGSRINTSCCPDVGWCPTHSLSPWNSALPKRRRAHYDVQ